jgi:TonB family protein
MKNPIRSVALASLGALLLAVSGAKADPGPPVDHPPAVSALAKADYPYALSRSPVAGDVLLDCTVDAQGRLARASVLRSPEPEFEAPAIEAALQSTFTPGASGGRAVSGHVQVTVSFAAADAAVYSAGELGWTIPPKAVKHLPPQFQYDEAPKPILTSAPVYPLELLQKGTEGKASVSFTVDTQGRAHVGSVTNYGDPEFGLSAGAMVASWLFEPAKNNGRPSWCILTRVQGFDREGHGFPVNKSADRLLRELQESPCPILNNARDLDAPPKGRFLVGPVVPDAVRTANVKATAVIKFIIDHAGHAQLPSIVSASTPEYGWAAATAVARWQFAQPTRNGLPADVFVMVPLVFNPAVSGSPGR